MNQDDRLTGPEVEAVRRAFAQLRALASAARDGADRRRLREFCGRLTPGEPSVRVLSEREVDVLAHAAIGLCNPEIAAALALTPETVKGYLRSALAKLGARGRQEAVLAARRACLLP